ncbi:MAG: PH domain-containing protein [Spirochaetota bacterium]
MKVFVLSPPNAVLYVAGAVLLVAVASILLKRGAWKRKAIALGIAVLVVAAILFYVYRPVTIRVDETGIEVDGAGGLELPWREVDSAVFEPDLATSPYRPTVRTRGVAIGGYRTGRFLLSNGDRARVFMVQSDAAVIVRTAELTCVLAPDDVRALADAVDAYRVYEGDGETEEGGNR